MNDELILQTIAEQVDRVINGLDGMDAKMAILTNNLTRLETSAHDLEVEVGRLKNGVERLDASVKRREAAREKRQQDLTLTLRTMNLHASSWAGAIVGARTTMWSSIETNRSDASAKR